MSFSRKVAFVSAVSVAALTAGAAFASGPTVVADPVVHVHTPAPVVRDWGGFYAGLSYSAIGGQINENTGGGVFPDLDSDKGVGVFVGYNWQRGNFVFGGELSYINFETPFVGFPASFQQNVTELRARAGYAVNNTLLYGFIGGARSDLDDVGTSYSQSGFSYGIGAQVMFRGGMFAGLELARRDVSGTTGGVTLGTDIDTVSLRLGFQF